MSPETSVLLDQHLEILQDSACGPAAIRTIISAALDLAGQNPSTVPTQNEIAKQVYSWQYFVLYRNPFKFKLRDNWCLPETVKEYLQGWFGKVEFKTNASVEELGRLCDQDKALMVLFQDVLQDKSRPQGYPDNLDNGHWAIIKAVNLAEGWVEIADTYRDRKGNELWFDPNTDLVLADEALQDRQGMKQMHKRIYKLALADFRPIWWDYRFNGKDKYVCPLIAVDLNSLTISRGSV